MRSEENAYKDLYYAERKAVCKYRSEALRYAIAYYKEKKQEIPTSYINILNGLIYCRKVLPWSYYKKK